MTTEVIDVVIKSSGTKRVVRDIDDIADAAVNADKRLQKMMTTLQNLASGGLNGQIRQLQTLLNQLGQNSNLAQLNQLLTQTTARLNQLANAANSANSALGSIGTGGLAQITGLSRAVKALMAGLSVRQVMEWADAWIAAAGKINLFAKSQDEANLLMEKLFDIAQNGRQPLSNVAQLYQRLTISGSELGATQNQMLRVTDIVTKSLAVQGTTATQARGALLQLSQMLGSGRVKAQEFNSVLDGMPIILKVVAQNITGAHGSVSRLREMMKDGQLTSKMFFDALLKGGVDIDKLFEKAPKTFASAFTVLVNGFEKYLGKLNESLGLSDTFFAASKFIADNLSTIAGLVTVVAAGIAGAFVPTAIAAVGSALLGIIPALTTIVVLLNANPFGVLAAAATAAYVFGDAVNIGLDKTTTLKDLMIALGHNIIDAFKSGYDYVSSFFSGAGALTQKYFGDTQFTFVGVVRALTTAVDAIGGLLLGLGIAIIRTFEGLPTAFSEIGKKMYNFMADQIENIVNAAIDGINRLKSLYGGDALSFLKIERKKVDETYFKNYGANIAGSIDAGFEMQGGFLRNKLEGLFAEAQKVAQARKAAGAGAPNLDTPLGSGAPAPTDKKAAAQAARDLAGDIRESLDKYKADADAMAEAERHKEALLKDSYQQGLIDYRAYSSEMQTLQQTLYLSQKDNLEAQKTLLAGKLSELQSKLQAKGASQLEVSNASRDLLTKIYGLDTALTKLNNHNEERLSDALTKAIAPSVELTRNADKELHLAELNTDQALRKLAAKSNSNQLSEREQFIQEELNKLTDKYEDKIKSIQEARAKMIADGAFDDMTNPAVQKAWNDINATIDKWQAALDKLKKDAPNALGQAFDAAQVDKFSDSISKSITDAIVNGGKNAVQKLRDAIKQALLQPFTIFLQSVIKQGVSSVLGSVMPSIAGGLGGGAGGGAGGAGSSLGSIGNIASIGSSLASVGTAFTAGSSSVGVMAGSIAGGGGLMGGMASALGAIGPVGWVALAALAAYAIFGGKGGGPKTESGFGIGVPTRGDPTSAKSAVQSIQDLYKQAGGTGTLDVGLFSATDPKGTAMTQLAVNANLNGQSLYSREHRLGGIENVGRGDNDLQNAVAAETQRVVLMALQSSNLTGSVGDYLKQLGDIDKLSDGAISESLTRAQNIRQQQLQLQSAIDDLTLTDSEKLTAQRKAELDAVDELNRSMVERLHALQDEKTASDTLSAAIESAKQQAADYSQFLSGINTGIHGYLAKLKGTSAGLLSPEDQLANARTAFGQQAALASTGNRDALSSLTQYADDYINAQKAFTAGGAETQKTISTVQAVLQSMPGYKTDAQMLQDAIVSSGQGVQAATAQAAAIMNAVNSNNASYLANWIANDTNVTASSVNNNTASNAAWLQNDTSTIWAGLWGSAGMLSTKFDQLDTNVDGLLDFNELKAALGPLASDTTIHALISRVDTNGDGQISRLEAIRAGIYETTAAQTTTLANTMIGPLAQSITNSTSKTAGTLAAFVTNAMQGHIMTSSEIAGYGGNEGGQYDPTGSFNIFAMGGVMSSLGKLPLNKYASGGVATSPQLAIFGEGRMNEAYVPLPDGHSIPVVMHGGGEDLAPILQDMLDSLNILIRVASASGQVTKEALEDVAANTRSLVSNKSLEKSKATVKV